MCEGTHKCKYNHTYKYEYAYRRKRALSSGADTGRCRGTQLYECSSGVDGDRDGTMGMAVAMAILLVKATGIAVRFDALWNFRYLRATLLTLMHSCLELESYRSNAGTRVPIYLYLSNLLLVLGCI